MRWALSLLFFGLATSAAARPASTAETDTTGGVRTRSICTLSRLPTEAREAIALDCVIHDTRPAKSARSDSAVVTMLHAGTTKGLAVVTGAPRAPRQARPDLALRAVIDPSTADEGDATDREVVLTPMADVPQVRIEVVASRL